MEPNMQSPQPPVTGAPQSAPQTPAPAPMPTPTPEPAPMPQAPRSHLGTILGVGIVVIALVLGGLYLWGASLYESEVQEEMPPMTTEEESTTLPPSTPDEMEAIENDLNATNVDSMDQELNTIDAEIDAALGAQ